MTSMRYASWYGSPHSTGPNRSWYPSLWFHESSALSTIPQQQATPEPTACSRWYGRPSSGPASRKTSTRRFGNAIFVPVIVYRRKGKRTRSSSSRERAPVVRCHGHSRTAPADETLKSFYIGDQRPLLQGYQDGPPANSHRIVGLPSILRPLGLHVRTTGLSPER
jgi:hypothetical protein